MKRILTLTITLMLLLSTALAWDSAADAYKDVLTRMLRDQVWFDNEPLGYQPEDGDMSDNAFAIFDIDSDGLDELVISFQTAAMASMRECVLGYETDASAISTELIAAPGMSYFENGIAVEWTLHNQGLAGDSFWPYTLHQYDATLDRFETLATLDAWDGNAYPTDPYTGNAFPKEVDADGDGVVYLITRSEQQDTVDGAELQGYLSGIYMDAMELCIPWLDLTMENVNAIS